MLRPSRSVGALLGARPRAGGAAGGEGEESCWGGAEARPWPTTRDAYELLEPCGSGMRWGGYVGRLLWGGFGRGMVFWGPRRLGGWA
jgi:hypothetical protein